MLRPIRRALLSVSDKTGLVDFARELVTKYGVELIATGGTKKVLADAGLPVKDIAEITKFPEMLDGRVKSLHPAIFAGLLAKRDKPEHMATLAEHNLPEIDLVVCNLYPFAQTVAKPGVTEAEAIENIDIGGPCMVRAAAKNFQSVCVLIHEAWYATLLGELDRNNGFTTLAQRRAFAWDAFYTIAQYDAAIRDYMTATTYGEGQEELPASIDLHIARRQQLRYGENPHQKAAFYHEPALNRPCIATAEQLHGKELSYNNILDLDSALNLVREYILPTAVVVKHNNPCGVASGMSLVNAFRNAWDGDPLSAFGGILAFNHTVDDATAAALMEGERFVECLIAPDYEATALEALKGWKKNVRLLKTGPFLGTFPEGLDYRRVDGGLLVQTRDVELENPGNWKEVTKRSPTNSELMGLAFAWIVCKHVKSNAIVLANQPTDFGAPAFVVGVGAGQMSRVESVRIAIRKAGDKVKGSVLASDAFFPFPDNVELAAEAGVTAIIQPGGSQKDADSIAACNERDIAMMFTGVRHFRH